jgi:hypothetical protein
MTAKNTNRKRSHLKVVPTKATHEREGTFKAHIPEGVPADTKTLCAIDVMDEYESLGIRERDVLVAWGDAPLGNYDPVVVDACGETYIGRYHPAPGGYVRLEEGDGGEEYEGGYHIFKPSEIQGVARVMHIERRGKVVKKFPLTKGGAR